MEIYIKGHILALLIAVVLDYLLGDPYNWPHPVKLIGKLISFLEGYFLPEKEMVERKKAKRMKSFAELQGTEKNRAVKEFGEGLLTACLVVLISMTVEGLVLWICFRQSLILGVAAEAILSYQLLAARCLEQESRKVYQALKKGNRTQAAEALSMIVGRDTDILDECGLIRGTVETVAENTADGVIAPFLFLMIGGPILGIFYKAVNTMDSMIGYRNSRYEYFGKTAARIDDCLNFIPARINAVWMLLCCPFLHMKTRLAFRIWRRDGRKHASPNSAQTESVVAGALGIRLAGPVVYGGHRLEKPWIGDEIREPEVEDIPKTISLLYGSLFWQLAFFLGIGWIMVIAI